MVRFGRAQWFRGLVLLILIALLVVGPGASIARAGSATWSTGSAPDNFQSLSCVSSSFCASVTGLSDDLIFDGSSWTESSVQGEFGWGWTGVSCVASVTEQCVALSEFGATWLYNGTSWQEASTGLPSAWSYAFSCGAVGSCEALVWGLSYGDFYGWNGTTWTEDGSTPTIPSSGAVDCLSASYCVAVASHFVYTFNGTSWTSGTSLKLATTASQNSPALDSVSCPSTTFCMVSDTYGQTFSYNGSKWIDASQPLPMGGRGQVSCVSATFCLATNAGEVAQYNGVEWSLPRAVQSSKQVNTDDTDDVACPTTSFYMITLSASDYAIYRGGQVALYPARGALTVSNRTPRRGAGTVTISLTMSGAPRPTGTAAVKLAGVKLYHGSLVAGRFTCQVPLAKLKVGANKIVVAYSGNSYWAPLSLTTKVTLRS
jgi:hypothetical protein